MHLFLYYPAIGLCQLVTLYQEVQSISCKSPTHDPVSDNPFGRNTAQDDITYPDLLSLNRFYNQNVTGFQQGHHTAALRCEAQGDTSM